MKAQPPSSLRVLAVRASVATALLVVLIVLIRLVTGAVTTTFQVVAATERIEFTTLEPSPSGWLLDSVNVSAPSGMAQQKRTGTFELGAGTRTTMERAGSGRLWIHVESVDGRASAGRFLSIAEEPQDTAPAALDLYVDSINARERVGAPLLFVVTGSVAVGRSVGRESRGNSAAVLRDGRVAMLSRSIFGDDNFLAGDASLQLGDQFTVDSAESAAVGFVRVGAEPGLMVTYRVVGSKGTVTRPGGGHFSVSATLLDRLRRDPMIGRIGVIAFLLGGMVAFIAQGVELVANLKQLRSEVRSEH